AGRAARPRPGGMAARCAGDGGGTAAAHAWCVRAGAADPWAGPRMSDRLLAGVELGGTKCVCTLASAGGEIVAQEMVPTAVDADETLGRIEAILAGWKA